MLTEFFFRYRFQQFSSNGNFSTSKDINFYNQTSRTIYLTTYIPFQPYQFATVYTDTIAQMQRA